MGLQFQRTGDNDSGIDGIAAELSSEFSGKLLVQAKRYRHPVPVDSVRSLYGEVLHQGASKGILITTSTFGRSAYSFAINKPLELIDGANLLYLLSEYAGIEANIATEPPR
jgi:restriction system protein